MTVIFMEFPPNIDAIRAVLPLTGREIFAYGGIIYNPSGCRVGPELVAHEQVHFRQQGTRPKRWWKKFLAHPEFRMKQELEAHRAEYWEFCKINRDRNARVQYLHLIARRLASPMYGGIMTAAQAAKEIAA